MMGCPYGARSFNWFDPRPYIEEYNPEFASRMRGVVEKCNFCGERLARGEEPACVEAVKDTGAIVFGDLNDPDSELRKVLDDLGIRYHEKQGGRGGESVDHCLGARGACTQGHHFCIQ